MNWKAHLVGGAILGLLLVFFYGFKEQYLLLLVLAPIYALLSDIDHKNSMVTWVSFSFALLLLLIGIFYKTVFLYFGAVLFALIFVAVLFFKHRGFTHSILFGLLVSAPVGWFFGDLVFVVVLFGVFWSHLLLDGIPFKLT